jgi:hypothetical protein
MGNYDIKQINLRSAAEKVGAAVTLCICILEVLCLNFHRLRFFVVSLSSCRQIPG